MKFKKNDVIIEVTNENTYSVFEREGFEKIEEDQEEKPAEKKKK